MNISSNLSGNFDTRDVEAVKEDIASRMKDGRVVFIEAIDTAYWEATF